MIVAVVTELEGIPLKGRVRRRSDGILEVIPWAHVRNCTCSVTETYTCSGCGRRFGWCIGCADDSPELCDFCWAEKHAGEE